MLNMEGRVHILAIEDDYDISNLLKEYLTLEGFQVEAVRDGQLGLERALSGKHDFVILDIMLPGLDGFEILRQLREKSNVPVLILTICDDHVDRVRGLDMGADDYLNKPFNPQELLARINSILRRTATPVGQKPLETIEVGDIILDPGSRRVYCSGKEVPLTAAEFTLLEVLLADAGQVVPREELVRRVQGRHHNPFDRSIDVHISRLRKKLDRHKDGSERIKAVRGVGHFYTLLP